MSIITEYRTAQKMTLEALAALIGTSPGYLHDLEAGRRKASPAMCNIIEAATGIPRILIRPDIYGPSQSYVPERKKVES
jgi:transcriptional regulator with XRE-family HTH domain